MDKRKFLESLSSLGISKNDAKKALEGYNRGDDPQGIIKSYKNYKVGKLRSEAGQMERERPQRIQQAQREGFQELPWYDRLAAGVGKTGYSTFVAPAKQALGQGEEVRQTLEPYEAASKGDLMAGLGEFGADVGLTLAPGLGIAKLGKVGRLGKFGQATLTGGLEGLGSAGVHQLQRYGEHGEVSPLEAGIETGASSILPGLGYAIGSVSKKAAPKVLRSAVKARRGLMESVNPPNFEVALEKGMVPFMGGLEESAIRVQKAVKELADTRDNLVNQAGIRLNVSGAIKETEKQLKEQVGKKLTQKQYESAIRNAKDAIETAKVKTTAKGKNQLFVSGDDAIELRKLADDNSKFKRFGTGTLTPKSTFYETLRKNIEKQMDNRLTQKNVSERLGAEGPELQNYYRSLKKQMADLIPYQKAIQSRVAQEGNNYRLGLMDLGAMGVGGTLGGLPAAAGFGTLRRLTSTPGGASMLYSAGRNLMEPGIVKSLLTQTGRSAGYQSLGGR